VLEAFERLVRAKAELLALLESSGDRDREMFEQMRRFIHG
jgi:hypothetical protein